MILNLLMIKLFTWETVSPRFKNSKLGILFIKLVRCKSKLKTFDKSIFAIHDLICKTKLFVLNSYKVDTKFFVNEVNFRKIILCTF